MARSTGGLEISLSNVFFLSKVFSDFKKFQKVQFLNIFFSKSKCNLFLTPLYSGKSYAGNGHLRFQITNERQAKALRKVENEFQVDWLAPHEGCCSAMIDKIIF